jgi:hypothetical protein
MVSERTALHATVGIALAVTLVALLGIFALAAYALNNAGFTPRVSPEETYDGPPLK